MGKTRKNLSDTGGTEPAKRLVSRQWSASALADSNQQMLGAKKEIDEEAEKKIQDTTYTIVDPFLHRLKCPIKLPMSL